MPCTPVMEMAVEKGLAASILQGISALRADFALTRRQLQDGPGFAAFFL